MASRLLPNKVQKKLFQPLGHVYWTHDGEGGEALPDLRDGPGARLQKPAPA